LSIIACSTANAQYYQFSQYNFAQQRVNPGAISLDDFATVNLIYRSQQSVADIQLTNFLLSAKYPLIGSNGGDRWSALGVTLGQDKTGLDGILETGKIGVSYALNFPTGKRETLSWGVRLNYHSTKLNTEKLVTGNQYVPDSGFDPNLNSGERFGPLASNYLTFGTGILWDSKTKKNQRKFHGGISIFDFNRPNESLYGAKARLPVSFVIEGGYRIYSNRQISLYPEFLFTSSAATQLVSIGMVTSYALFNYNPQLEGQIIEIHTKYLSNQGAVLALQWHNGPVSIGVSYDIPINQRVANRGSFEIGLKLGKLIESRYKARKLRKRIKRKGSTKKNTVNKSKEVQGIQSLSNQGDENNDEQRAINDEASGNVPTNVIESEDNEVKNSDLMEGDDQVKGKAKAGNFKNLRIEENVYFNFNFPTDNAKLQPEDQETLDELVLLMKANLSLRLEITGHTDDVGNQKYNQKLSERRAKAVADYLIESGIDPERIENRGYGETRPLVENRDDKSRAKNRRVEFILH